MTALRTKPVAPPPSMTADAWGFVRKYPTAMFIAACVVVVNLLYAPMRFADYDQYLVLTDGLYYFANRKWLDLEIGSNLLFLGLRILTGNTIRAVNLAHYLLGAAYIYFTFRLAHRGDVKWRGLMITFVLYGSLLAFVTIRATPAYMLVTLGVLDVIRGRKRGIVLTLAASLFHVSAVLALPPILLGYLQTRWKALYWIERSTRAVAAAAVLLIVLFAGLRTLFASALASVVSLVPFLNKYDVYTAGLDPNNAAQGGGSSIVHLIYAVVMSAFMLTFVLMPDERCRKMRLYVIASYVIFLLLEFAPVTAFRQSQFWAIPAMLVFPWHRFIPSGFRAAAFAGACAVMFAVLVRGIIT